MVYMVIFCVFFFDEKTAHEMRIRCWSSDVCSSDLCGREARGRSRSCRKRAGRFLATAYNRHDRFRKPAVMTPKPVRKLSHLDAKGRPAMVDVSAKAVTAREAVAECRVKFPAAVAAQLRASGLKRSGEHTSELQSLMRLSYAVFCLKKK